MVTIEQVQRGFTQFVDGEISKLSGMQKWAVGAMTALYASKLRDVADSLQSKPAIAVLGVICDNNRVDIDALYNALRPYAERCPATIDIPVIGTMTLTSADIDRLYDCIRSA